MTLITGKNCLKGKRGISGFTLFELLIVLVVVSMSCALTLPYVFNFKHNLTLNDASRTIIARLKLARSLALTRSAPYRVQFDLGQDSVTVFDENDTIYGKVWRAPTRVNIYATDIAGSGRITYTFNPEGTAVAGDAIHIEESGNFVENRANPATAQRLECHTITLSSASGYIHLYPYGIKYPWPKTSY